MKKALLVIDMQNDYLWDKRKPMFSYDTDKLVENVFPLLNSFGVTDIEGLDYRSIASNLSDADKTLSLVAEGAAPPRFFACLDGFQVR